MPEPAAVTSSSPGPRISTYRNFLNCRGRCRLARWRRASRCGLYPRRARSSCLHERKTARHHRHQFLRDDPSDSDAPGDPGRYSPLGLDPSVDAVRLADRHSACSGSRTDPADHIHVEAVRALQPRDGAHPAFPLPLRTRYSYSESTPRDTPTHASSPRFSRITA